MTPELPKNPNHSTENSLSQHEERFGKLKGEIMETLRPHSALIIVCSDSEDPVGDNHLSVNKNGKWSIGFGREGIKPLGEVGFRELLQEYAVVTSYNALSKEVDIGEYVNRMHAVKMSAIKDENDNPVPFATNLLERMEQALNKYGEQPY